ncbi:MAG: DUF4331 domain-containing protein [Pyrinomonadaceae bacterium MAG19_C2-C3]|nr:DUF4331 domain-containing protein [Pyrinomonadaceae bacterium MAG19_C2-C3]
MSRFTRRHFAMTISLAVIVAITLFFTTHVPIEAADHGDSPIPSLDRAGDLADVYSFLDPNDNTRVILMVTVNGFIVPGEAVNFGIFDPGLRYRFNLEMTGDATPDKFIDVRFSRKVGATATSTPQTATVTLMDGTTFTAPTTPASLDTTAPQRVITMDQATGVRFYAGLVDDPFRFDIPGFRRFVDSVTSGAPNPAALNRGRDTFAGYNVLAIAFSFPISMFQPTANNEFGVEVVTSRTTTFPKGRKTLRGAVSSITNQVDRVATPAVNVALIPFNRKDEHNLAATRDDAAGRFANSIVGTLRALGTPDANINLLASIAVTRGDFVRLNLGIPNQGDGGGSNAQAAFPNGRRLGDDVVDTLLTVITNGAVTTDNANANDVPFTNTFPFFGLSHQPREPGVVDDQTRN